VIQKKSKKAKYILRVIAFLPLCNPILAQVQTLPAIEMLASNKLAISDISRVLDSEKQFNNILAFNDFENCNVKKHPAKIARFQHFSCHLYPNPCPGSLCIEFEKLSPSLLIKIINTKGKTICTIEDPNYINVVLLPRELSNKYIVSIADETHEVQRKITMH